MNPPRRERALAAVLLLALVACAENPITAGQPKVVAKLALAPYEIHEDCAKLAQGDRLDYRFESTEPLAFNIHYHDASMVIMPISRDNAMSDAGVFAAPLAQDYCMMWEAGGAGATLDYRVLLRRAAR